MILLIKFFPKKISLLVRKGLLFTIFSFLNSGINFLLVIVLAKYFSPTNYGELNLFNTLVTLLGSLISLSTTGYISIAFFKYLEREVVTFITGAFLITFVVFIIACIFLLGFSEFFGNIIGISSFYILFALVISFMQVFSVVMLDIWRVKEKIITYGLFSVSIAVLNFVLTICFITNYDCGWYSRIYAQLITALCFFIISITCLYNKKYITFSIPQWSIIKKLLYFGIPLIPHVASLWLRQGADRYIINYYYTAAEVGIFSFALNFSNLINVIGSAFNATNSVYIYRSLSEGYTLIVQSKLMKQNKIMFFLFLGITFCIILVVVIGIPLFFSQYVASIKYVFPLCLSSFFQCLYLLYVNYLFYFNKTKELMYITFSMSVLQVLISFIITRYDILYTAYLSLFISFATFLLVFLYGKVILKRNEVKDSRGL